MAINITCSRKSPSGISDVEIQASIIRLESISFKSENKTEQKWRVV